MAQKTNRRRLSTNEEFKAALQVTKDLIERNAIAIMVMPFDHMATHIDDSQLHRCVQDADLTVARFRDIFTEELALLLFPMAADMSDTVLVAEDGPFGELSERDKKRICKRRAQLAAQVEELRRAAAHGDALRAAWLPQSHTSWSAIHFMPAVPFDISDVVGRAMSLLDQARAAQEPEDKLDAIIGLKKAMDEGTSLAERTHLRAHKHAFTLIRSVLDSTYAEDLTSEQLSAIAEALDHLQDDPLSDEDLRAIAAGLRKAGLTIVPTLTRDQKEEALKRLGLPADE